MAEKRPPATFSLRAAQGRNRTFKSCQVRWPRTSKSWRAKSRFARLLRAYFSGDVGLAYRQVLVSWCWCADSNCGPTDYESVALPTELHQPRVPHQPGTRAADYTPIGRSGARCELFPQDRGPKCRSGRETGRWSRVIACWRGRFLPCIDGIRGFQCASQPASHSSNSWS